MGSGKLGGSSSSMMSWSAPSRNPPGEWVGMGVPMWVGGQIAGVCK